MAKLPCYNALREPTADRVKKSRFFLLMNTQESELDWMLLEHLDRIHSGDELARDELMKHCAIRFEIMARKMLQSYPVVRRWVETGDILQSSMIRLLRALEDVKPSSAKHFFALATTQLRRELIDLTRRYQGPQGQAANHASWLVEDGQGQQAQVDRLDETHEPSQLARWCELHDYIAELPEAEREVCELLWYQGLSQPAVAKLLGVSESTIKRRWQTIRVKLHELLEGEAS